jgi:hypothetical protein
MLQIILFSVMVCAVYFITSLNFLSESCPELVLELYLSSLYTLIFGVVAVIVSIQGRSRELTHANFLLAPGLGLGKLIFTFFIVILLLLIQYESFYNAIFQTFSERILQSSLRSNSVIMLTAILPGVMLRNIRNSLVKYFFVAAISVLIFLTLGRFPFVLFLSLALSSMLLKIKTINVIMLIFTAYLSLTILDNIRAVGLSDTTFITLLDKSEYLINKSYETTVPGRLICTTGAQLNSEYGILEGLSNSIINLFPKFIINTGAVTTAMYVTSSMQTTGGLPIGVEILLIYGGLGVVAAIFYGLLIGYIFVLAKHIPYGYIYFVVLMSNRIDFSVVLKITLYVALVSYIVLLLNLIIPGVKRKLCAAFL